VSKRSKRRRDAPGAGGDGAEDGGRAAPGASAGSRDTGGDARQAGRGGRPGGGRGAAGEARQAGAAGDWSLGLQLAFLVAVFAVVVLVAELAGAANLGVALGVGQIAFAIAVIYLLLRR
jgi:hypothetical protein